jgi:hypothetical protein
MYMPPTKKSLLGKANVDPSVPGTSQPAGSSTFMDVDIPVDLSFNWNPPASPHLLDLGQLPTPSAKDNKDRNIVSTKSNFLLAIIDDECRSSISRKIDLGADLRRIEEVSGKLKDSVQNSATDESQLKLQMQDIESQLATIDKQIAAEDQAIDKLTTQIEMENEMYNEDAASDEVYM